MGSRNLNLQSSLLVHVIVFGARIFLVDASSSMQNAFTKVFKTDLGLRSLNHVVITDSDKKCSLECLISQSGCRAFAYEAATGKCSFTTHVSPNATLFSTPGVELYTYMDRNCDNTLGYWQYTFENTSACIYLSVIEKNYMSAFAACQASGGRLFAVKTMERMKLIQDMLAHNAGKGFYWVGLDDRVQENIFVWSDGTTATAGQMTTLFEPTQPDNYNNEDCIEFKNYDNYMNLNDDDCSSSYKYICEPVS